MDRIRFYLDENIANAVASGLRHREIDVYTGVAYYKPQTRSVKQIIQGLLLIYDVLLSEDMLNHIEYL